MADVLTLRLEGEIDPQVLALFLEQLASAPSGELEVDLEEADVSAAAVVARLADALRREARRIGRVRVIRAPQVLAHTLYRVGALGRGTLELVEPRDEIGSAG